jgi:hypothetical protein
MIKYNFKRGVKKGNMRYCPGNGMVTINDQISDATAEKMMAAGIDIFVPVKASKKTITDGDTETSDTSS